MKTAKSIFLLSILLSLAEDIQSRCDRTPEGNYYPKTQQNGRFSIHISGSPDRYVPGERYTGTKEKTTEIVAPNLFSFSFSSRFDDPHGPKQIQGLPSHSRSRNLRSLHERLFFEAVRWDFYAPWRHFDEIQ